MKKLFSLIITAFVTSYFVNFIVFPADSANAYKNEYIDADYVYNSIISMKSQYPEGMKWTNDNYYQWNGGIYKGGYGCSGFAFAISDKVFGTFQARQHKNLSKIKVGDILRLNNDGHSVIVLEKDGNIVTVAEGNYNNSIHWGRKIDLSSSGTDLTYVMTRYPKLGDINNDNSVDANDASLVLSEYANLSTKQPSGFDKFRNWAGDTNNDGLINSADASDILAFYAYMSTHGDAEEISLDEVT